MNRRHFFTLALPALLGPTRARALDSAGAVPRPVKVKVDIVRAKPEDVDAFTKAHPGFSLRLSRREVPDLRIWLSVAPASSVRTITVTTNEDALAQVTVTEPMSGQNAAAAPAAGVTFQHLSTSVGVTPHINAGGTLTLTLSLEDTQYSLAPDPEAPRHILTQSASATHTGDSGETFCLGPSQPAADGREWLFFVTPSLLPAGT